jgi:hypothetical protein
MFAQEQRRTLKTVTIKSFIIYVVPTADRLFHEAKDESLLLSDATLVPFQLEKRGLQEKPATQLGSRDDCARVTNTCMTK